MATRTMTRDWEKRTITILGVVYDYTKLEEDMQNNCGFLGFGTKLVDNLAGMSAYTNKEKTAKVDKVYKSLLAGIWKIPGTGGASAKAERAKVMEAYDKASVADKAVMRKCLVGQGYEFPKSK